jgi:phosphoadenosine phosphosulfate reductase
MTPISCSRLAAFYGHLEAEDLLRAMILHEFKGKMALITSFGTDSALLLEMVSRIDPHLPILFLETGKHFAATLAYGKALVDRFALTNLMILTPNAEKLTQADPAGDLWRTNPNRCCYLRKTEPLRRAVEAHGFQALITGRKRYQTPERQGMETIELDADGVFRLNPLAHWSAERVEAYYRERNLPPHPLVAEGYASIGCEPCTLPVEEGKDPRAGRWAHTIGLDEAQKTECGIHLPGGGEWSV